jgi:hypothetical protein
MKTKRVFFLVIFLIGFNYCFSQSVDEKLLVKYDSQSIQKMKVENPDGYDFLSYFVESAWYIVDMPEKAISTKELVRTNPATGLASDNQVITSADLDNFNPLEYNVESDPFVSNYYIAGSTGKLIVIPARSIIENAVENNQRVNKTK